MRSKLFFASTLTLGILLSFVFIIFYLLAYWAGVLRVEYLLGLTLLTNLLFWLVTPWITDWMQRFFYHIKALSFDEFKTEHPEAANFMSRVCTEHRIPVPRLRIIEDANPTAYCYGSYPRNARLVLSAGIFKYLDTEGQKAVIAHELGHIVNRDFIVMTIAATLLEILYEVYYVFLRKRRRSSGRKKGDVTPLIGALSYALYLIGTYVVLYLSRTREYLADQFSARCTHNPDALSMALVKIAYGIATEADSESTERLLGSTRAMGIYDFRAANTTGSAFKLAMDKGTEKTTQELTKVFLFDLYNPWAALSEINSTHPLTGKRILALSRVAKEQGKNSIFDFNKVLEEGSGLDKNKLYQGFYSGLMICSLPFLGVLAGIMVLFANPFHYPLAIAILGFGLLLQGLFMFRKPKSTPEETTVLELMQDPYANPLQGRYVQVEGDVIGKADAGSYLGEDLKMQDKSGCLILLNYESLFPIFGNIFFGLGRAAKMIGQKAKAIGWFRRSSFQVIDLETLEVKDGVIPSYTKFWGIFMGATILFLSLLLYFLQAH